MKRRILCLMTVLCSVVGYSQGIQWTTGLSWREIKEKAKEENRYIFLDCYATWCGPCKQMDRDIYPLAEVGKIYNSKFISVRVQADRSAKDDEQVKSWYEDARKINDEYKVGAYPTFLFFSPDGELVHRASGGYVADQFISLAKDAVGPKAYVKQVEDFKKGQYARLDLKRLAFTAQFAGDAQLSKEIATVYVQNLEPTELIQQDNLFFVFQFGEQEPDKNWARDVCMPKIQTLSTEDLANTQSIRFIKYAARNDLFAAKTCDYWISKKTDAQLFNSDTLEYVKMFLNQSTDKGFQLLYKNAKRVDKIMDKEGWTVETLALIILKEEFYLPIYNPAAKAIAEGIDKKSLKDPDWRRLNNTIGKKYGSKCAEFLRLSAKINWYDLTDNKRQYTKNLALHLERTNGMELDFFGTNNTAMEIFRYSTSTKELRTAIKWMKKYNKKFKDNANGIDTYAALLYKAGQVKRSILLEQKAAAIDPASTEIADNLSKMKKGLRIWPKGYDVVNKLTTR